MASRQYILNGKMPRQEAFLVDAHHPNPPPHRWIQAKSECQEPRNIGAWLPLLRSLAPGLIAQCIHSREQAERFVAEQLTAHMFEGDRGRASQVAMWFADFSRFKSHGRPVTIEDASDQGLNVSRLEDDQVLQDLVLSIHHAVRHTFNDTGTTKLIENHHGRAYIEITGQVVMQQEQQPIPAGGGNQRPGNRQQRRQGQRGQSPKGGRR